MCSWVNSWGDVSVSWSLSLVLAGCNYLCLSQPVLAAHAVLIGWQKGALVVILPFHSQALVGLGRFKVFGDL